MLGSDERKSSKPETKALKSDGVPYSHFSSSGDSDELRTEAIPQALPQTTDLSRDADTFSWPVPDFEQVYGHSSSHRPSFLRCIRFPR
jgi:hypothetical protein